VLDADVDVAFHEIGFAKRFDADGLFFGLFVATDGQGLDRLHAVTPAFGWLGPAKQRTGRQDTQAAALRQHARTTVFGILSRPADSPV